MLLPYTVATFLLLSLGFQPVVVVSFGPTCSFIRSCHPCAECPQAGKSDTVDETKRITSLYLSSDYGDGALDNQYETSSWKLYNDFPLFLNQCTLQSFFFLLKSMRDPETVRWLENFTQPIIHENGRAAPPPLPNVGTDDDDYTGVSGDKSDENEISSKEKDEKYVQKEEDEVKAEDECSQEEEVKEEIALKDEMKEVVVLKEEDVKNEDVVAQEEDAIEKDTIVKEEDEAVTETADFVLDDEKLTKKYGQIEDIGERAFQILLDLGMVSETLDPDDENEKAKDDGQSADNTPGTIATSNSVSDVEDDELETAEEETVELIEALCDVDLEECGVEEEEEKKNKDKVAALRDSGESDGSTDTEIKDTTKDEGEARENDDMETIGSSSSSSSDEEEEDGNANSANGNSEPKDGFMNRRFGGSRLLQYHGHGTMNTTMFPTWESYFTRLLERPQESFLVESSLKHVPNYELDINPASLCTRMISVRDQIAREFAFDLGVIAKMGNNTIEKYRESTQHSEGSMDGTESGKIERESLMFLAMSPDTQSPIGPSPLRKGNFDLLLSLITQEAIHRILNDETRRVKGTEEFASNTFLHEHYSDRLLSHFTGSQRYGRADDFVEELLLSPPRMIQTQTGEDNDVAIPWMIDPNSVAEMVLRKRDEIALEWKALAENVPEDHMRIKRLQLNLLMKSYQAKTQDDAFE